MNFVIFHVDTPGPRNMPPGSKLSHSEWLEMIELMVLSARLFDPQATLTILTDFATDFSSLPQPYTCLRYRVEAHTLLFDRVAAWRNFVHSYDFATPVCLVDPDILINNPLDDILQRDFDVGLTWRKMPEMPINAGFIVLNNRRPERVRRFFDAYQEIFARDYAHQAGWFGEQRSLYACVGGPRYREMRRSRSLEVHGSRIAFLPCDVYNFSPQNDIGVIRERFADKVVVHFKGERKPLMERYWDTHLMPLQSRDAAQRTTMSSRARSSHGRVFAPRLRLGHRPVLRATPRITSAATVRLSIAVAYAVVLATWFGKAAVTPSYDVIWRPLALHSGTWTVALTASLLLAWILTVAILAVGRRDRARAFAGFIPDCLVLVGRLMADRRVPRRRKLPLLLLFGYISMPIDPIPDFIPIAGQLDDALVFTLVMRHFLRKEGEPLLRQHWPGPESSLRIVLRCARA
jgi:uncharacterized membrane protein YkvA (DUF1232 family)